ncbi:frequency clock protein [Elsinoe australis]|uniref:Frequency clock protein n=1 Tax=Elsinoe australis TaxID=40998 RepID=A0A4U7AWF6_9PEZI|nr:frequency clock protein [Elsinoe australis]
MDVDTSSSNSQSSGSLHPRRQPAHKSVSLVHSPRPGRASSHEPPSASVQRPQELIKRPSSSPSSLKPLIGKDDSGESSNAEKWFDRSNNYASRNSTSFVDNSPPFFLQHSSSDETPPDGVPTHLRNQYAGQPSPGSLQLRTGLLHLGTDNSSTEDFRGVIDDLTIENKKLKRKLKKYEKLHDSHLKDQKLFEVRVHGLPVSKKKELEEMLRRFALELNPQSAVDFANNLPKASTPALLQQKSVTSPASNPFADSAYMSASGQGSSAQSSSDTTRKPTATTSKSRQQNIQTYLHDIPEGLLPRQPSAMTERSKKKLIVRRLEQIFAGKGAVTGNHQPQQQQEVSQLAAKMDRSEIEGNGHKVPSEGVREAMIMSEIVASKEAADNAQSDPTATDKAKQQKPEPRKLTKQALEQRPTRPLDLDPYRAQVPSENMQYIRHLGFSPPGAGTMSPPEEGHGWIYLNLLANMAQIHTLNATSEFVQSAIQERSKKLELSSDGRKVRWKGGRTVTKTSSDGDNTPSTGGAVNSNTMSSERGSPRKRLKISQQGSSSASRPSRSEMLQQEQKLAYTPLFHHQSSTGSDTSSDEEPETTESPFPMVHGDSSGMTSSGMKTTSTKRKKARENGPIIFYNNAKFCTDLSGDAKTEEAMIYNAFLYHSVAQQPVGTAGAGSVSPGNSDRKGPLNDATELPEAMQLDDNPIPAEQELTFPTASPISSQPPKDRKSIQFEVSGLGGVYPADNFAINVESRHSRMDNNAAPAESRTNPPRRYPEKIARLLSENDHATGRTARMAFHKELVDTRTEILPPSQLPDASCFMPADDTSPEDDETSDAEEDAMSISPGSPGAPAPSAAPQRMDMDYESDDSEDGDDEDEDSDSGSLDFLATARERDPDAIRAKERQYDAEMADRLAEEIPAGSSAATAGGGSGFTSPGSGVDRAEWEAARKELKERVRIKEREMRKEGKSGVVKEAKGILKRRRSEAQNA